MQRLGDISQQRVRILTEIREAVEEIRACVRADVRDLRHGVRVLDALRQAVYEKLNQLQHDALILDVGSHLQKHETSLDGVEWEWNPGATGGRGEPDLRGRVNDRVVVSAEVTTSREPKGSIKTRMKDTHLEKLRKMDGRRFYCVRTKEMEDAASKLLEGRTERITVLRLEH